MAKKQTLRTKPSHFTTYPWSCVERIRASECETVARNIMVILSRTGDAFRELTLEEYITERNKDEHRYHSMEEDFFLRMRWYCVNAEEARKFSPEWNTLIKAEYEAII